MWIQHYVPVLDDTHCLPVQDLNYSNGEHLDFRRLERARHEVLCNRRTESPDRPDFTLGFSAALVFRDVSNPELPTSERIPQSGNSRFTGSGLWHDRLDPCWPFRLVVADPPVEPPQDGGHLLVVQHEHQQEHAALVSTFWHDDVSALWSRTAHLLPQWLSFDQLLAYSDICDECRRQDYLCLGFVGAIPIENHLPIFPRTGTHFELHAEI